MDAKLLALYEHKYLLETLGYEIKSPIIDLVACTEDGYDKSVIKYDKRTVGDIGLEVRNMCYLYRDNRFVGNKDLSEINFSKSRKKNMRTLVHTRLFHNDLNINCFNMLHSVGRTDADDRNFICLSDSEKIMISKYLDNENIEIISLVEKINNEDILEELRKPQEHKSLTYRIEGVKLDEYKN